MKRSLLDNWQFKATDEESFLPAVVPGCQFLDLLLNNVIPDPFIGVNEVEVQWVHDKDYLYKTTFSISQNELLAKEINLVCEQLDTICEVRLNGALVGRGENCHRAYVFEIKEKLRLGENELTLLFFSPKKYVKEAHKKEYTPANPNGQNGIVHIRKPQCHFGWDWGPVLIPAGISGDIGLEFVFGKKLGDLLIDTRKTENGFLLTAQAENADEILLRTPKGETFETKGERAAFTITDPELWWPKELSNREEQPLYTVEAIAYEKGVTERRSKKIGLRTITLDREKDEYGENFRFIVNGVPLFAKGANYIPADCFITRFTKEKMDALFSAVQFSNMNMIRVWGGGYYASEAFLDECDRRGILVWQDFAFACQAYPFFDQAFLQNVLEEVEYNVKRMRTHPSLALWCGNNEIEAMHMAWAALKKYVAWTEKFFYEILPQKVLSLDDGTPYIAGSPLGSSHNKHVDADYVGDTHLWGVWHGFQPETYYGKRFTRFCSEFGLESLPSFKTTQTYASPKEYPLHSPVQRSHQKCASGNDRMLYYMASRFRIGEEIQDLIYLSQITQASCVAYATEHWRRHKGRCNGALYWQLNDCWQTSSWSSYDYCGEFKALQYLSRHFNAPLSLSLEKKRKQVRVFILNDYNQTQKIEAEYSVFYFSGGVTCSEKASFEISALSSALAFTIPTAKIDARKQGIAVRLYKEGELLQQKTLLLLPEKKLTLPKETISIREEIEGDMRKITLRTPVYQRFVFLQNDFSAPFSDNYFDMLPGEEKIVYQSAQKGAGIQTPTAIKTVATLKKGSALKTIFAKIKPFLFVNNIASALYYRRPHKIKE